MKSSMIFIIVSVMLLALGCSSISVKHDYDREANFVALKKFAWMQRPTTAMTDARAAMERNTLLDQRIENAVNGQLVGKGLRQDSNNPDFLIAYHVGIQDKIDVTNWGYAYAGRGRYYGWAGRSVDVHQYQEGTLIVDFVDAKSKQLIWRATAQKALDPNPTPEKIEKNIGEAVAKMLEKFPPPPAT